MFWSTGVKFCTMVSTRPNFKMLVQNLGGLSQKNFSCQNMQNLAWFRTTLKFSGEYLWNGWRYLKSDKHVFDSDSFRVKRNKSGEVQSSNLGHLDIKLYPPKAHFSVEHICAPKCLHSLENHLVLPAHSHRGKGPPLQLFSMGVNNWFKMW